MFPTPVRPPHVQRTATRHIARTLAEALEPRRLLTGVEYPANSGVINLTNWNANPALNAKPNDGLDDTAAIQAAIGTYVGSKKVLYLPDGVYNVSDRIYFGYEEYRDRYLWLQGQSQAGTILKLSNNNPLFQDGSDAGRRQVLDTYRNGNNNRAFGQYVSDLTVDVGVGNPGAVGIRYMSNNFGSLRNVTIRSSDPAYAGAIGLDMAFSEPGPSLVKNLTVVGFQTAIVGAPDTFSATLENINISNQTVDGIATYRLPLSINNLVSTNAPGVKVIHNLSSYGRGNIVLTNATLTAVGTPVSGSTAVLNDTGGQSDSGLILLRNVTTSGYQYAVRDLVANVTVPSGTIAQYTTQAQVSVNSSPATTLNLPIVQTPEVSDPLANWVSVTSFGATTNAVNAGNVDDDTAAIQAALNSGASTVYFPSGYYSVSDTLVVPATVKRIAGLYSQINVIAPLFGAEKAVFKFTGSGANGLGVVQPIQQIDNITIGSEPGGNWVSFEQATLADVVIADVEASGYRNTVRGGRVFIEDISGTDFVFDHQTAYGRQINPEGDAPASKITNIGGSLWILGLKVEGKNTIITTSGGGRTEVLGGLIYPVSSTYPGPPAFINNESSLSMTFAESTYIPNGTYYTYVRETRDGITIDLNRDTPGLNFSRNGGLNLNLYTGYKADVTPPPAPVLSATRTTSTVSLTWPAVVDPQTTVAGYKLYRNGTYLGVTGGTSFTDTGLSDATAYTYIAVAYNAAGLSSGNGTTAVTTLTDTVAPSIVLARADQGVNTIALTLSEPLKLNGAVTSLASYTVSPTLLLTSATLSADGRTITLKASSLTPGSYTVSIIGSGITDRATTPLVLPSGSKASFSVAAGTGLLATYYNNVDFTGTTLTRVEPVIDLPFGFGSPDPSIDSDTFSARFEGFVVPNFTETYTFQTITDDGVRLWVNGQNLVNRWQGQAPTAFSGSITLEAGKRYPIVMDYFEGSGGAQATLRWSSPSQVAQVIPTASLFPAPFASTPVILRTNVGQGADTAVNLLGTPYDSGTYSSVGINNRIYGSYYSEAVYIRFDLSSLGLSGRRVALASYISNLAGGSGDGIRNVNVFGVLDSLQQDNWPETGPGFLTWATAAGSNGTPSGGNADPATSVYLGRILVDNTGYQLNGQADGMAFTDQRLADFLNADTDGRVTLVLKRLEPNSYEGTNVSTKEESVTRAPGLVLALTPSTLAAPSAPELAAASDTGSSSTDNYTRLNNATPGAALTFTLANLVPGSVVTLLADGLDVGQIVATGTTATLVTRGNFTLTDGSHVITAVQQLNGITSAVGSPLGITVDTVAPTLTGLTNLSREAVSTSGTTVTFTSPTATDVLDPAPVVGVAPASGSLFAMGTTQVAVTGTDKAGNVATGTFNVTINDPSWLVRGVGAAYTFTTPLNLSVSAGSVTLVSNAGAATTGRPGLVLQVPTGATVNISASQTLGGLTLSGGIASMTASGNLLLVTQSLDINGAGTLNVRDNAVIVRSGNLGLLSAATARGLNASGSSLWTGTGITSSVAAADANIAHGVGVIANTFDGSPIYTDFRGVTVSGSDVLLAYTLFGDADLSGTVDDTDYFLANNGYLTGKTGWLNGDFDYSGLIDDTDFFLLNNGFLSQ